MSPARQYDLIATEDGSLTLKDEETGELYHNRAGAYAEALVNYTQPSGALTRLNANSELAVLDVCFGLGYNSFVLIQEAINNSCVGRLKIIGVEQNADLLAFFDKVLAFNRFGLQLKSLGAQASSLLLNIENKNGKLKVELNVVVDSLKPFLQNFHQDIDLVFHDPFSAKRVPELWTVDVFRSYYSILKQRKGAVLTYGAASAVRGGLAEAGFIVKKTPSLGAKSGGTLALVDAETAGFNFTELDPEEREKLKGRSGIPYRDDGFRLERAQILKLREQEQTRLRGVGGGD